MHASAFAYMGFGCMITGAPGTGKSTLVADALMMNAKLIADDQVVLSQMMGMLSAAPPANMQGIMELPGIGLIKLADTMTKHVLHLVVELDAAAEERVPELQTREFLGVKVPYLKLRPVPYTSASALLMYLKAMQEGRVLPADWKPLGN